MFQGEILSSDIVISLAQVPVIKGDVPGNLASHLTMVEQSSSLGADVVVFPELSLTGYELELVQELAFHQDQTDFSELSQAAVKHNIIVIAGCPLKTEGAAKSTIGAVICFPDGCTEFYSKQYLHDGEGKYCSSGVHDYLFNVKGHRIGLAICADFSVPDHALSVVNKGAEIYLVSALISPSGFEADAQRLSDIASTHKLPVLLSNHISHTGGWETCGNDTVWDASGNVVLSSESKEQCLVLCTVAGDKLSAVKA